MSEDHSFSDDFFISFIENSRLLKSSTKIIYLNKIDIMTNKFFGQKVSIWWIMNHPKEFREALVKYVATLHPRIYTTITPHTVSLYIRIVLCLFAHHREVEEQIPELYYEWKQMKTDMTTQLEDHYLSGKPTIRQQEAMMSWDDIVKMRDQLPDGSIEKLIISMYTMIPPQRCDYRDVRIYNDHPLITIHNYIVLKNKKLFINEFKTSRFHQPIEIDLPEPLMKQLNMSLEQNPRDYLFVTRSGIPFARQNTFNTWINGIVKRVTNKPYFTLTMFRHLYVSRSEVENMSIPERRKLANNMGHSTNTNLQYELKKET